MQTSDLIALINPIKLDFQHKICNHAYMIHNITIENFFSIAGKQELAFAVPGNTPDLPCFMESRSDKDIRLPTVVGFFGANASGKSTMLRAIVNTAMFVCHSFSWGDPEISTFFQAYRQKEHWGKPTKITLDFDGQISEDSPSVVFRYELHIANKASDFVNKVVSYESLSYAPKGKFRNLFEREGQIIRFGKEFADNNDPRKDTIRPNASVISTLAKFNHPLSSYIIQFVGTLQSNIIGFNKIQQNSAQWLAYYASDKTCLDSINRELRRCDVGIESMIVEQGNNGLFAKFQHTGLDNFIFLEEESSGTKRFIEIFPRIHYALATGSVAIIDEIDTDLHSLLLPELFRWFGDKERNPHGAQLIMTAHNPAVLDDLEKEQVFFTEKPSGKPSYVYGARNIKGLRREPSLMKKYLAGELGAIPHIG